MDILVLTTAFIVSNALWMTFFFYTQAQHNRATSWMIGFRPSQESQKSLFLPQYPQVSKNWAYNPETVPDEFPTGLRPPPPSKPTPPQPGEITP